MPRASRWTSGSAYGWPCGMKTGMRQSLCVLVSEITSVLPQSNLSEMARPRESKSPGVSCEGRGREAKKEMMPSTHGVCRSMVSCFGKLFFPKLPTRGTPSWNNT
eukprot:6649556-Alexandrium_andersonii.AAC.1